MEYYDTKGNKMILEPKAILNITKELFMMPQNFETVVLDIDDDYNEIDHMKAYVISFKYEDNINIEIADTNYIFCASRRQKD